MATTIQIKRGTGSAVPSGLLDGELAINLDDGTLYFGSGSNSVNDFTFTNINASNLVVTRVTSSIVTSSIVQTEGSNIFGDTSTDTHTFTGDITASGNISASGPVSVFGQVVHLEGTDPRLKLKAKGANHPGIEWHEDTTRKWVVYNDPDENDNLTFKNDSTELVKISQTGGLNIATSGGHITASGNISSSGTITGLNYINDGTVANTKLTGSFTGSFDGIISAKVLAATASHALTIKTLASTTAATFQIPFLDGDDVLFDGTSGDFSYNPQSHRFLARKILNNSEVADTKITGSFTGSFNGGTIDVTSISADTILVGSTITHIGDSNTKITFSDDDINLTAAGKTAIDITYDGDGGGDTREITFNEGHADIDVRIEGDTDANLFFTDAGNEKVGIGTNKPSQKLTVAGDISASGFLFLKETGSAFQGIDGAGSGYLFASSSGQLCYQSGSTIESVIALGAGGSGGGSDNLGNHTATQDLNLDGNSIKNILNVTASGNISASANSTSSFGRIKASGDISASSGLFVGVGGSEPIIIKPRILNFNPEANGNGVQFKVDDVNMKTTLTGLIEFELNATKIELGTSANNHVTASGNISSSGTITGNSIIGTLGTAAQTNITSVGTLSALTVSGDITANGNIVGDDATDITNIESIFADNLVHDGDTDTKIAFGTDTVQVDAGGTTVFESSITGSTLSNVDKNVYSTSSVAFEENGAIGDIVKFGNITTTPGAIYHLNHSASGGWTLADADHHDLATGSIAVAVGTNSTTDGMCLRGIINPSADPNMPIGAPCYLQTTPGRLGPTPPSGTGDVVRIVGYKFPGAAPRFYFNPSNDFIIHA